jgi:hypothetical protein
MSHTVSADKEVAQLQMRRPHVVILGAGASYAACPEGDAAGRPLPLMANFVEILHLEPILDKTNLPYRGRNFEDIYSELSAKGEYARVRQELEKAIDGYFSTLELPKAPNLYDHLVLSLREKDVIATFNWDPFLVQAFRRNCKRYPHRLPRLLFLHGNVMIGYCRTDMVMGLKGNNCSKCGSILDPSRLLFPVSQKNYEKDDFIVGQWRELADHLKSAYMVSLFGYGAPKSDAAAIDLLENAWGTSDERNMEEIEIINVLSEDELVTVWKPFIHSHHYSITDDFYSSWLANHPRRTGEAYLNQFIEALYIENHPVPKDAGFDELWDWFDKLVKVEAR